MPGGFGWNSTFFLQLVLPGFWSSGLRAPDSLQIPSFLCFRPSILDSLQNSGRLASALTATEAKHGPKKGQNVGQDARGGGWSWKDSLCKWQLNPQKSAWQAAFMPSSFFRPLILDSMQNFGLLSSVLAPFQDEKLSPRRAKMGPRCQWRRLKLEGWHRILCKIPWGEELVHRSPVRKYFSSSPWAKVFRV